MIRKPRATIDDAMSAVRAIEGAATKADSVSPLVSWAGFQIAGLRTAEKLTEDLPTVGLWDTGRADGPLGSHTAAEVALFTLVTTSVCSALDLCVSATLRLAGFDPKRGREFDFGEYSSSVKRFRGQTTSSLRAWLDELVACHPQFNDARHQAVHRWTSRGVQMSAGTPTIPFDDFIVGSWRRPLDEVVTSFIGHGETMFEAFCKAIRDDLVPGATAAG